MRNLDSVSDGEVGEYGWLPVDAVDDGDEVVARVDQDVGVALGRRRTHVVYARYRRPVSVGEGLFEFEFEGGRVGGLEDVDDAVLGAGEAEAARVVELHRPNLSVKLEFLDDPAVGCVDESEHRVGVGNDDDVEVEGQEGRCQGGGAVRKHLQTLTGVRVEEPSGLVYGGGEDEVLQRAEPQGRHRSLVTNQVDVELGLSGSAISVGQLVGRDGVVLGAERLMPTQQVPLQRGAIHPVHGDLSLLGADS
mmetsp:Transcript_26660/g.66309  ORF Transcript_26660/g.66309 Transcript_26660/m.66309 type:complete len:249 (+) Transcript_26660:337-1083(+)